MNKPEGYDLQQALRWIASEMELRPDAKRWQIVDEAARRFDLSPQETEMLLSLPKPRQE